MKAWACPRHETAVLMSHDNPARHRDVDRPDVPPAGPWAAVCASRGAGHAEETRGLMAPLATALAGVAISARDCTICGNIGTADTCAICADDARATGEICVVEDVADLWALERSRAFKGRYHVLGGTLSALDGVGPETLRIPAADRPHRDRRHHVRSSSPSTPPSMARPPRITSPTPWPTRRSRSALSPKACRLVASWTTSTTAPLARPSGRGAGSDPPRQEIRIWLANPTVDDMCIKVSSSAPKSNTRLPSTTVANWFNTCDLVRLAPPHRSLVRLR